MQIEQVPGFVRAIGFTEGRFWIEVPFRRNERRIEVWRDAAQGVNGQPGWWWKIKCGCTEFGWLSNLKRDEVLAAFEKHWGRSRSGTWRRLIHTLRFLCR